MSNASWRYAAAGAVALFTLAISHPLAARAADLPAPEKPLPDKIDYNRDVRPILSDNCFSCHGFDKNKRKADLRLDTHEGLLSKNEDGVPIVVPGKPAESELFKRVVTDDPDQRMPDPKSTKRLSPRDVAVLQKWIEQGAVWQGHWAFIKPVKPEPPKAEAPPDAAGFVRNDVDRFILAKLKENGLTPSAEADRRTLLRRVTFDLTGLPPTASETEAFVNDKAADAFERVVDRLLASPAFGERMAVYWLDLVRYADSAGYHSDNPINVTPYRDWVIRAFNDNVPFDRFTTEQIAGDLLPDATPAQKVASAYNRLLQTTEEGGAQAKEYVQKYLADRVRNVSTVWMGATVACAQCHDHKFDPIGTKDFYTLGAFFADVQEAATGRREPGMPVPTAEQAVELTRLDDAIADAKRKLDAEVPGLAVAQAEWEKTGSAELAWRTLDAESVGTTGTAKLRKDADGVVRAEGKAASKETYTFTAKADVRGITGFRLEVLDDDAFPARGPGVSPNGNFVLTEFKVTVAGAKKPVKWKAASADHSQDEFPVKNAIDGKADTGWAILPLTGKPHVAVFEPAEALPASAGDAPVTVKVELEFGSIYPQHSIGKFRLSVTTAPSPANRTVPGNVATAVAVAPERRTDAQRREIAAYYRTIAPQLQPVRDELARLDAQKAEVQKSIPTCLISTSGTPRVVRILPRGNWMDDTGEVVQPTVPHFLPPLDVTGRRATRLDLARWLTARDNPLTARVFVNRAWKLYFGTGISKVLDDLGAQGEWPTHPELLDWLAVDFRDHGWDVKRAVRQLVTSGTYRQGSKPRSLDKERDPYNRLYAHQSRFRLDAEMVRDNVLSVSGLLVHRIGGPSAFPYQPPGYWFALNFPTREWKNDKGAGLYRRGLYTHWQRSFLHPSLLAFDAQSREEATCERARSNIPQQALVLLNDPTYVEAARVFAGRMMKEGGASVAERIRWAYAQALSRPPREEEVKVLSELYAKHAREYGEDKAVAQKVLAVGDAPAPGDVDAAELAAWTSVARAILNLNETITRY